MTETESESLPEIEGSTIVNVRRLTDDEMEENYWMLDNINPNPVALELDNGTVLYPSRDPEGNGPGALFGESDGTHWTFG